ncbi:formimidoylglutamate deiminase [Roseovarius aestuarii]|nr:formimidoylglutamate deiminase [Roseovarius aestuarii]
MTHPQNGSIEMGFHFKQVLTPLGWVENLSAEITDLGNFGSVTEDENPKGFQIIENPVVPGMVNLHSHSFQYAMAGLSECRRNPVDSFWSWREMMYYFAHNVSPEDLQAITAKLYMELLKGGYTETVEFHYLHNDMDGRFYANPAELSASIFNAAHATGMGLTHLPVFYAFSNFGGQSPTESQRRFINTREQYARLIDALKASLPSEGTTTLGIAPHSLRAVDEDSLQWLLALRQDKLPGCPVHIHVAEQTKEVADSQAHNGMRPVTALMAQAPVDENWCLIHATHLDDSEVSAIAKSGATVGLCPLTESNLGDGIFPAVDYLGQDGHFGIGSDSNISTDPRQELRMLEYSQRLIRRERNVLCSAPLPNTGAFLWSNAAQGGARAAGKNCGAIETGLEANFIELPHDTQGAMACVSPEAALDFHIFSGQSRGLGDVYVKGKKTIENGHHPDEDKINKAYFRSLRRLSENLIV